MTGQKWCKYVDLTHQLKITIDEKIYEYLLNRSNNKDEAGARGVEYVINHSLNSFLSKPILAKKLITGIHYEISILEINSTTKETKLIISNQDDNQQTIYLENEPLDGD